MIRRSSGDRANRRLDKLEAEVKRAAIKSTQAAHDAEAVRLGAAPLTPAKANTVMAQMHDRIRTLEAQLAQAKADREVLARAVLDMEAADGRTPKTTGPIADALSRAGGK